MHPDLRSGAVKPSGTPRAAVQRARSLGAAHAILNRLGLALILVASDRRILHANKAAEAVLGRGDGLTVSQARLGCAQQAALPRLAAAVAATARSGQAQALVLECRGSNLVYQLSVVPMADGAVRGALILFADPHAQDETLAARLRALFQLTPAEAYLAVALTQGEALQAIAARRAVGLGTVRGQVKSIAAKMHCRRQAQIAAVVARLPVLLA